MKKIMLVIIVLNASIILLLSACSSNGHPSNTSGKETPDVTMITSAIDEAWQATNLNNQPNYLKKLNGMSVYEVTNISVENNTFIVNVTVQSPDLGGHLMTLDPLTLPQTQDADAIDFFLCNAIDTAPITERECLLYIYIINDEYHVSFSESFVDAMCGNVYAYAQSEILNQLTAPQEGN